jgi:hypothetical protein
MTFEPPDDDEIEMSLEATGLPVEPRQRSTVGIRGPITRRRERRILIALTYFGPLPEGELYGVLRARKHSLAKALLNLSTEGAITRENDISLHASLRVWSVARPEESS